MRMRTVRFLEGHAVKGSMLTIAMSIAMAKVTRDFRAVRKRPRNRREQWMASGEGRGKGWVRGRQWGKNRRRGRERVKRKVLLNNPSGR
jgi:hypothetical protein